MKAEAAKIKECQFQAETQKLLDVMTHSLYNNKEILLRELISNASDALDRLRFEALTNPTLQEGKREAHERIHFHGKNTIVRQLEGRLKEIPLDVRVLISKRHAGQKNSAYFASTRDCKPQVILQGYTGR